ncbi:hypothetical protein NC651_014088 [Populus alba x Populus x berolinensis]|nr:hypothetical protein NC651_014088 [Populus alba x Populus x berolinensis]
MLLSYRLCEMAYPACDKKKEEEAANLHSRVVCKINCGRKIMHHFHDNGIPTETKIRRKKQESKELLRKLQSFDLWSPPIPG